MDKTTTSGVPGLNPGTYQNASAGTDDNFIAFSNVEKSYDGKTLVVQDLDFTIRQGEFLSFLGPSGSGKTTSLMMLAGFEHPTSGEIYLNGQPLSHVPPHRREFGMVFQDYALFPSMTVFENVAFPLSIRRLPKAKITEMVNRALDMVELTRFHDRRPSQLSGGQQQRVALARALVYRPRLVLMDEPLGALDKQLRDHMQLEIKHIQQRLGITVVYVTHDQHEALAMSDRIAVFNGGKIRQIAAPDTLYENPADSFVADFVGENNSLSGNIVGMDDRYATIVLDSGSKIVARYAQGAAVDQKITVSVRPERVELNPSDLAAFNHIEGKVKEIVYQGDTSRLRLTLDASISDFVVKIPVGSPYAALRAGESITLAWHKDCCWALRPEQH